MKRLLHKELRLSAAPVTYYFLAFALMTLIPGYPILVGGFFCHSRYFLHLPNSTGER